MATVRASLPSWGADERLLWVLCATTGMRAGEAFLIKDEFRVGGIRCIELEPTEDGETIKTGESVRRIPIPAEAISYLPNRITGPLFSGSAKNVSRNINRALDRLGVKAKGKTLKSTRHRAAHILQNSKIDGQFAPPFLGENVLGHKIEGTHRRVYAGRYPMEIIKPWIDMIGLGSIDRTS